MLATAAAQLVLGVAVVGRPTRRIVAIAAATDLLQSLSQPLRRRPAFRLGLPSGHPEPLSISDLVCPALELSAGLLLVLLVAGPAKARRPRAWLTAVATLPAIPLVVLATAVGALAAPDDTWPDSGQPIGASPGKTSTLAYCSPGGSPLAVDVTEPAAGAARPAPTVLYVHGGGWTLGDRQTNGDARPVPSSSEVEQMVIDFFTRTLA